MKRLIPVLLGLLALAGCSSLNPACYIKDKLAVGFTDFVVAQGQCENPQIVHDANVKLIEKFGVCTPTTGPVGAALCAPVINELVSTVVPGGFNLLYPGAGCKAPVLQGELKAGLTAFCVSAIPVKYKPPQ